MDRHERKSWFTEQIVRDLGLVETLIGKPKLVFLQACRGGEDFLHSVIVNNCSMKFCLYVSTSDK